MVTVYYKPSTPAWFVGSRRERVEVFPNAVEATFEEKEVVIREAETVTAIPRENVQKVEFSRTNENE